MVRIIHSEHTWYIVNQIYPVIFDPYTQKYLCSNCGRYIEPSDCEVIKEG